MTAASRQKKYRETRVQQLSHILEQQQQMLKRQDKTRDYIKTIVTRLEIIEKRLGITFPTTQEQCPTTPPSLPVLSTRSVNNSVDSRVMSARARRIKEAKFLESQGWTYDDEGNMIEPATMVTTQVPIILEEDEGLVSFVSKGMCGEKDS